MFNLSPRVLRDIIRELDPVGHDHPERPFPFIRVPVTRRFWRHRELAKRLKAAEPVRSNRSGPM